MHDTEQSGLFRRRRTRTIHVGNVAVGGDAPVSIQSMTNTDPHDVEATLTQIGGLAAIGCEIIRVALPDEKALGTLPRLLRDSPIPVVADIHFDPRLALGALDAGVHGLRINPGTISDRDKLAEIARRAAALATPVRIGVNSGSIEKALLETYGAATPEALVDSAASHCLFFEEQGCRDIKVSLKTSRVTTTVAACRLFAARTDYPLHLGVTEAGTVSTGTVKSAVGIGTLLLEGIGDTLRVSLTGDPAEEVVVARRILESAGLRHSHPDVVSCPTCGRTQIELVPLVTAVENEIARLKAAGYRLALDKVAVMGCVVNGPGEARDADLGVAGGRGQGALFKQGKVVRTVREDELLEVLLEELRKHAVAPDAGTETGDEAGRRTQA